MSGWATRRRGQPLVAIAVLLGAWIGARAMVWESPLALPAAVAESLPRLAVGPAPTRSSSQSLAPQPVPSRSDVASTTVEVAFTQFAAVASDVSDWPVATSDRGRIMAGHHLLWLAASAELPVPSEIATLMRMRAELPQAARSLPDPALGFAVPRDRAGSRWSLDAWMLYRPDARESAFATDRPASYGASQAGAVLRYRFAGRDPRAPALYLRGSHALAPPHDDELALGLSAFPLSGMPLSAHAEVRATRVAGRTELRPAAFAVTHLAPARLPLGLRGEAYAQAGYVGGRYATAFADGQARVDREVLRFDLGSLRAGAGTWGGAQKGAARLDLGPTASLDLRVADVPARVAVDYRVRVAGDAAPGSGIAVTLSTGF